MDTNYIYDFPFNKIRANANVKYCFCPVTSEAAYLHLTRTYVVNAPKYYHLEDKNEHLASYAG